MEEKVATKKTFKDKLKSSRFVVNYKKLFGEKTTSQREIAMRATARIAYTGVLVALATLFNVITFYPVKYLAFSLSVVPTFLAGIMLGPVSGFLVGFLGDLLGWLILPQGAYMPLIGVSSGLWGAIGGLIFLSFDIKYYFKIIICFVVSLLFCTSFLNTFNLWLVYSNGKSTFWAYLWLRLPFQFAMASINCFLTIITYRELQKAKVFRFKKKTSPKNDVSELESDDQNQ